jgi:hypothetical protein
MLILLDVTRVRSARAELATGTTVGAGRPSLDRAASTGAGVADTRA